MNLNSSEMIIKLSQFAHDQAPDKAIKGFASLDAVIGTDLNMHAYFLLNIHSQTAEIAWLPE